MLSRIIFASFMLITTAVVASSCTSSSVRPIVEEKRTAVLKCQNQSSKAWRERELFDNLGWGEVSIGATMAGRKELSACLQSEKLVSKTCSDQIWKIESGEPDEQCLSDYVDVVLNMDGAGPFTHSTLHHIGRPTFCDTSRNICRRVISKLSDDLIGFLKMDEKTDAAQDERRRLNSLFYFMTSSDKTGAPLPAPKSLPCLILKDASDRASSEPHRELFSSEVQYSLSYCNEE